MDTILIVILTAIVAALVGAGIMFFLQNANLKNIQEGHKRELESRAAADAGHFGHRTSVERSA